MKKLKFMLALAFAFCLCACDSSESIPQETNLISNYTEENHYTCGKNVTWDFDETTATLTISGTDEMQDFGYGSYGCIPLSAPWVNLQADIKTVVIENGVTTIGNLAFDKCTALESITIPDSVTKIGSDAFRSCTALQSVMIPEHVTEIGDWAFDECTALESITIPEHVTRIADTAFLKCSALQAIHVAENNQNYSSENGVLFDKNKTILITFPLQNSQIEYTIPESVTEIEAFAFYENSVLKSITIPEHIKSIDDNMFFRCSALETVVIPDSVTEIGDSAFSECSSLKSIIIPDSVTYIGDETFSKCTALESITIPESVTYLGIDDFLGCSALQSLTFNCNLYTQITYHDTDDYLISNKITIYGSKDSIAESYAEAYHATYICLDET
ncbi:MAG: leucine-rich repeat domain-containing protein [Oscillospiraceae bacterium]|nr:leucine-rich repeat domain-containing protein [Oscillospiraceae bacterium]